MTRWSCGISLIGIFLGCDAKTKPVDVTQFHFNEMAQNQDVFFVNSINTMDFTQFPHFLGEPQRNCRILQQGPNKVSSVGSGANCQLPVPCPKHFQHGCECWKERGKKHGRWKLKCKTAYLCSRFLVYYSWWWREQKEDAQWFFSKALFMESMVRWSWMSRLPRSDSTFLVRMIHRFSTSETDGSGKQRAEHGVLSSGQRVCTGFIGLSFDCLKSFAGARVSKLVLTGAHSTFLNNPYWFQFNLLIFDGQITRNPNFSTGFLPILSQTQNGFGPVWVRFLWSNQQKPEIWGVLAQVWWWSHWQARTTKGYR